MADLRSMTLDEMESLFRDLYGEKKFRAAQVYEWINKRAASSFDEMTNISKELRARLERDCRISVAGVKEKYVSSDDLTTKYLFELEKDTIIESVLMNYSYGSSVCVSTQAGCRMGCKFCASAISGLARNLTAGEICAQIYEIQRDQGSRISNIVVMGSGEPFDNYENLIRFIRIITSKEGLNIGARHITVSTCGLADKILAFAEEGFQVNLAVSLHAPNNELRKTLMPIANKFGLDELLNACAVYATVTGRRVTYEYALVSGVNDTKACANELGRRLRGMLAHVNLIPLNEISENEYTKSDKRSVGVFAETLTGFGVETTIRRELGADIDGACGQLRLRRIRETNACHGR